MAKIDFSKIKNMVDSSLDFSITEKQYEKLTGRKLPKDNSYIINKSALANFAKSNNLKIIIQEKTIRFEKES